MTSNPRSNLGRRWIFGLLLAAPLAACSNDDPRLTPPNLPTGSVGEVYEATIRAEELDGTPTWSIEAGALPPGLDGTADGSRWVIAGTPVTPGSFQFLLRAQGDDERAELLYRLVITGGADPLKITTTSLPEGTVGTAYQALLTASGGSQSGYIWSAERLPDGLEIERRGAFIAQVTGTPTAVAQNDVLFRVTDDLENTATATLTLTVTDGADSLRIVTPDLPAAVRGQPYETRVEARGGSGEGYVWASDLLPRGLVIDSGTPAATIRGTPVQDEPSQLAITVTVVDSQGNSAERSYTLSVKDPPRLVISPKSFADGAVGEPYSESVQAVGGVGPYAWSISAGSLPTDLALQPSATSSTTVAGTPSEAGLFNFTIQVQDDLGATDELAVEIFIQPAPLQIVPSTPPLGTAGMMYSATIEATGGAAPYAWRVQSGSALPPGLALTDSDTDAVVIAGTPSRVGTFDATLEIEDALGTVDDQAFNFVINPPPNPLAVVTSSLAPATVGQAYIENIDATGGTGLEYRWSVAVGSLPPGLSLEDEGTPSTLLLGIPTSTGTFDFTVQVQDSAGSIAQAPLTLTSTTP